MAKVKSHELLIERLVEEFRTLQAERDSDMLKLAILAKETDKVMKENVLLKSALKEKSERVDVFREALVFMASQDDLAGNWAVEMAKKALNKGKL